MGNYYLTRRSLERLKERVTALQRQLKGDVARELARAAGYKDFRENAEWDAALEVQGKLKHELAEILQKVQDAALIEEVPVNSDRVTIGTRVTLYDVERGEEFTYTILGEEEADLGRGIISYKAPLARGLLKKEEGEEVEVTLPGGRRLFEVVRVEKADLG
ncbi:MAG: GreA/GreB family elongation factor [Nitrospinota bacterium]